MRAGAPKRQVMKTVTKGILDVNWDETTTLEQLNSDRKKHIETCKDPKERKEFNNLFGYYYAIAVMQQELDKRGISK